MKLIEYLYFSYHLKMRTDRMKTTKNVLRNKQTLKMLLVNLLRFEHLDS